MAQVERRSRTIVEADQKPDPENAGLNARFPAALESEILPSALSIVVANAGGMGGCGALLMQPDEILAWSQAVRENPNGGFQINLWIPHSPPERDAQKEERVRKFLLQWAPPVQLILR